MIIWPIIFTLIVVTRTQLLNIQDLTSNNGYLPIKVDEVKTIEQYNKILHVINITAYTDSLHLIYQNIKTINSSLTRTNPETESLVDSITKNYEILDVKVSNLKPHFRERRGLVNVLGKGLKYIAGTMDSDDETQINNALNSMKNQINNLTTFNNLINNQIQNITNHINQKQIIISTYFNKFKNFIQNKIRDLEDEFRLISHIYQVNNDITLLKNHVDDIGQIIFSSKLGIIPTDILTKTELDLITSFDSYTNIKVAVIFENENIVIILLIPQYSNSVLSKIIFEPIPNLKNKSISLKNNEVLVDTNNKIYETKIKENLKRNLIQINDNCLENIVNFKEANCKMTTMDVTGISEIMPGVLIFKNFYSEIKHNCNNKNNLKVTGTFLIKFENCEIYALDNNFTNVKIKLHENFILPNFITKIKEDANTTITDLKLESLYLEQIKHEETIKQILYHSNKSKIINISIDIIIILAISTLILILSYMKTKSGKLIISSEPQSNGGGVISSKTFII